MTTQTTTWPEGVIARYLTAGGATVDLSHGSRIYPTPDGIGNDRNLTATACTGCLDTEEFSHWTVVRGMYANRDEYAPESADLEARNWAQSHAEKCRAMPKPTV